MSSEDMGQVDLGQTRTGNLSAFELVTWSLGIVLVRVLL